MHVCIGRVPCPYGASHTVKKSKLQAHLLVCPNRLKSESGFSLMQGAPVDKEQYIRKGVNTGGDLVTEEGKDKGIVEDAKLMLDVTDLKAVEEFHARVRRALGRAAHRLGLVAAKEVAPDGRERDKRKEREDKDSDKTRGRQGSALTSSGMSSSSSGSGEANEVYSEDGRHKGEKRRGGEGESGGSVVADLRAASQACPLPTERSLLLPSWNWSEDGIHGRQQQSAAAASLTGRKTRHKLQAAALASHIGHRGQLQGKRCFVDLGAGKGVLSLFVERTAREEEKEEAKKKEREKDEEAKKEEKEEEEEKREEKEKAATWKEDVPTDHTGEGSSARDGGGGGRVRDSGSDASTSPHPPLPIHRRRFVLIDQRCNYRFKAENEARKRKYSPFCRLQGDLQSLHLRGAVRASREKFMTRKKMSKRMTEQAGKGVKGEKGGEGGEGGDGGDGGEGGEGGRSEGRNEEAVVVIAKHLCGVATDFALKCTMHCLAEEQDMRTDDAGATPDNFSLRGVFIALCCHHLCRWKDYPNRSFLRSLGITASDFRALCRLSSWAVSFSDKEKEKEKESQPGEEEEKRQGVQSSISLGAPLSPAPVVSPSMRRWKRTVGYDCKRLIDAGRLHLLRECGHFSDSGLCHFVEPSSSLESLLLYAVDKRGQSTTASLTAV